MRGRPKNPDNCKWTDRGCKSHPHCLSCPEPVCILELGKATVRRNARRQQCLSLIQEGLTKEAIALQLGVSVRTVQRM